jgi:hypothetical protein
MRATSFLAMAVMLAASAVGAAPDGSGPARGTKTRTAHVAAAAKRELTTASATSVEGVLAPAEAGPIVPGWARSLGAIAVENRNTEAKDEIRLYGDDGSLDREAARAFMLVAAPKGAGPRATDLDVRLVQLAIRASYHFDGAAISIVSATRRGARGKHGTGQALDFALEGVRASTLAAYLRTYPRAGVGIYTHPNTQYVHLDVRDRSYHWIDASPPGVTWRERLLPDPHQAERDASYAPVLDLPEAATRR